MGIERLWSRCGLSRASTGLLFSAFLCWGCQGGIMDIGSGEPGTGASPGSGGTTPRPPVGTTNPGPGGSTTPSAPVQQNPEALSCQGKGPGVPFALRRLTRFEYSNTIRDLLNVAGSAGDKLAPDEVVGGYRANSFAAIEPTALEQYGVIAAEIATEAVKDLSKLLPCDPAAGEEACAATFIDKFGQRVYRRPLTTEERGLALNLYKGKRARSGFSEAIKLLVEGLLQAPQFVYHVYAGEPVAGAAGTVRLTDYEIASRLSYFLWGTMPDEALFTAAAGGKLKTVEGLKTEVNRLLAGDRINPVLADYHRQWLDIESLIDEVAKDETMFPNWANLGPVALAETDAFVQHVFNKKNGSLEDLLTGTYSLINQPLAAVYGVTGVTGAAFQEKALPAGQRAGLLTQISMMSVYSGAAESSPIHRGKVVREQVLCTALPSPPADVDTTPPKVVAGQTTRERYEPHRTRSGCTSCHQLMDPIGFAFENYDAIGAFRTMDNGAPVDASGELVETLDINSKVENAVDLAKKLNGSGQVQFCVTRNWFRYAFGRDETAADECALKTLHEKFRDGGFGVRDLVTAIATSDAFRHIQVSN